MKSKLDSPTRRRGTCQTAILSAFLLIGGVVTGQAAPPYAPLSDSPTSTAASDQAPLAERFRELYSGEKGMYDPARGLVQPDETHFDIAVQAAHNGENIFIRTTFPTPLPSFYHDYWIYKDGDWLRGGRSPVGTEPHGAYEDRVHILIDDGSVPGFANQGGWITCHDDLRDPFMYNSVPNADVQAHPLLGEHLGRDDQRKYIPSSRDAAPDWWQFNGWGDVTLDNLDRYEERRGNGVFLDLWHWRSHRSQPIGYSDNQLIFDHRLSNPGRGMYFTNWDGDAGQPIHMFDESVTGYVAMDWDRMQEHGYSYDDYFFLAEDVNLAPFDPDHEWKNGDVIPRRVLRVPEGSRGMIRSEASLVRHGPNDWTWDVVQWRPMDTGREHDHADKQFRPGRTYDVAIAIHRLATGSRWHYITFPFTVGIDMPGKVTAKRFEGERPDWEALGTVPMTVIYPGQTNWQWLVSDEHPGAENIRNDSMGVVGCHDESGLALSNREIEAYLAGHAPYVSPTLAGTLGGLLDPANIVFLFIALAVVILAGAVSLGKLKDNSNKGRKI